MLRFIRLIPNPAKEENFDEPLYGCEFYADFAGILYSVAVFVCYGYRYRRRALAEAESLVARDFSIAINTDNGLVGGLVRNTVFRSLVGNDLRIEVCGRFVVNRPVTE